MVKIKKKLFSVAAKFFFKIHVERSYRLYHVRFLYVQTLHAQIFFYATN